MNLLVFTPTWDNGNGLQMRPETSASILAQQVDGHFDFRVGLHNPFPIGDHQNVLAQYQEIQREFLEGEWDALLTIEHDHRLPDPGAIQRLYDTPGDIVYGPYPLRHVQVVISAWQYLAGSHNLGMPLTNYPRELEQAKAAGVWRVSGVGMGCTLFRRHVMEVCPFHGDGRQYCPDIPIAQDAARLGFESYANFTVLVDHYHMGEWLTLFKKVDMIEYVATKDVSVITRDGRSLRLVAGHPIELSAVEARELSSVGYIETKAVDLPVPETVERATLDAGAETATIAPEQTKAARKSRKTG